MKHYRLCLLALLLLASLVKPLEAATTTAPSKLTQLQTSLDADRSAAATAAAIDKLQADYDAAKTAGTLSAAAISQFQARLDALKTSAASAAGNQTTAAAQTPLTFLQAGSININNRTKLVTAEVFANYSQIFGSKHTVLGYRLSASLPSPGASAADYATSQLLLRDGGLVNLYFSLSSFPNQYPSGDKGHIYDTDKRYIRSSDDSESLLVYILSGVGLRGYSPNTNVGSGASGSTPSTIQAMGTAYLGFGFDGPSFNRDGRDGSISFEIYAAENVLNKQYLTSIYNTKVAHSAFGYWSTAIKLSVSNYIISAFYSRPLDANTRSFAKDIAGLSISYNGKTTEKPATAPAAKPSTQ